MVAFTPLEARPNVVDRLAWLALVIGSVWLLTSGRRRRPVGIAAGVIAVLWGFDEAVSLIKTERWSAGQGVALFAAAGLIAVSGLIARELWPEKRGRWFGTAAFVAAYPIVLGMGVLFHPESLEALLAGLTMLTLIRGERRGWPLRFGVLRVRFAGLPSGPGSPLYRCWLLCRGSAALRRPSSACVYGRHTRGDRRRRRAVAGIRRRDLGQSAPGEPQLAGSHARPRRELPASTSPFRFVTMVSEPYLPHLENEFLPAASRKPLGRLLRGVPSERLFTRGRRAQGQPTQSAIGLIADLLAIGGLAAFGMPAVVRAVRRGSLARSTRPSASWLWWR